METPLYNPVTGSKCSGLKEEGPSVFCFKENTYSYVSPIIVLAGCAILEWRSPNEITNHGKTISKVSSFGYLALDGAYNFFFPQKEEINLTLAIRYSKMVEDSTHKDLSTVRASFEEFSMECENEHGFTPSLPPAFHDLDGYNNTTHSNNTEVSIAGEDPYFSGNHTHLIA